MVFLLVLVLSSAVWGQSCRLLIQDGFVELVVSSPPLAGDCNPFNASQARLAARLVTDVASDDAEGFYDDGVFRARFPLRSNGGPCRASGRWSGTCLAASPPPDVSCDAQCPSGRWDAVESRGTRFAVAGAPFFPVGLNVAWAEGDAFEPWLDRVQRSGGTFVRVWLTPLPWNRLQMESNKTGLGRYDAAAAADVDRLLSGARARGIYVMMCLLVQAELQTASNPVVPSVWASNPYNAANGGPCASPADFFTSDAAFALIAQRYRYLASRFSAFSNVFAWEHFNEVDQTTGYDVEAVVAWHRRAVAVLATDGRHLQSSSLAGGLSVLSPGYRRLFAELDFAQKHQYFWGSNLDAQLQSECTQLLEAVPGKPVMFGEFGIFVSDVQRKLDPSGLSLHSGLWGSLLSECAASAMSWWWDTWVEPLHLFGVFSPVAAAVRFLGPRGDLFAVANVSSSSSADCVVLAATNGGRAVVWARNANFTYAARLQKAPLREVAPRVALEMPGGAAGPCVVTYQACFNSSEVVGSETLTGPSLQLQFVGFNASLVALVRCG